MPEVCDPMSDKAMAAKVADLLYLPAAKVGWDIVALDNGAVEISLPSGRVYRLTVEEVQPE